jgi:hypothetical protein
MSSNVTTSVGLDPVFWIYARFFISQINALPLMEVCYMYHHHPVRHAQITGSLDVD